MIIDGRSTGGTITSKCPPLVEIRKAGLHLTSSGNRIKGLIINSSPGTGIWLTGDNNVLESNYIGTNRSGDEVFGNRSGVLVIGANNEIKENLVSGNAGRGIEVQGDRNRIESNKVGTTAVIELDEADCVQLSTGAS